MTDFEKEVFKSLIRELNNFSNNNRAEIKRIRDTTKLISKEMLEYIADNDLLDIFVDRTWSGVFVPSNYFAKIEIPEKFVAKLNEKNEVYKVIKNTLASNFLNLNLPVEWITKYPNAFDYTAFKPDKELFEVLIDKYPDIIFGFSHLNASIRKKFTLKRITDEFLDRYVMHIDFSSATYYRGETSQFSPKVVDYLLGSISKIKDPNMYRVFRSLLNAISSIKGGLDLSEFSAIVKKSDAIFREDKEMMDLKAKVMREVSNDKFDNILQDFEYFMEIYKLGLNLDSHDFSDTSIMNYTACKSLNTWRLREFFKKFADTGSYKNAIIFIESARMMFDDEFIVEQLIEKMLSNRKYEAEKAKNAGRYYWNNEEGFDSEKLIDTLRKGIESDPIMKERHGRFISSTLLRLKLA